MKQNIKLLAGLVLFFVLAILVWDFFSNRDSLTRQWMGKLSQKPAILATIEIRGNIIDETDVPVIPVIGAEIKCGNPADKTGDLRAKTELNLAAKTGEAGDFSWRIAERRRPFFFWCEFSAKGYKTEGQWIRIIDQWEIIDRQGKKNGKFKIPGPIALEREE